MSDSRPEGFHDHFSGHAGTYAAHRPRYPAALFDWLARIAPGTAFAWDVGTGNGQAATGLVTRFARVVATDPSAAQVANAERHPRIAYAVARYESGLPDATADLVTVAQALHWFDMALFLPEVRRVLRPGGVLAAFAYVHGTVTPEVDALVRRHHDETLGPYWPAEHHLIADGYRAIAMPIDALEAPAFEIAEEWTLAQYVGFLRSWSATQRCLAAGGEEMVRAFESALAAAWGEAPRRAVRWPMVVRAGTLRPG